MAALEDKLKFRKTEAALRDELTAMQARVHELEASIKQMRSRSSSRQIGGLPLLDERFFFFVGFVDNFF